MTNLYDLGATSLEGADAPLSAYRGRAALVVNVASACGYTKQYAGLEELAREYAPKGLVVLGFPSNEFGGQEPGTPEEIRAFCTSRFGVTFPLFAKCEVKRGERQSPVYAYLTQATGHAPKWNFCKYVVGRDGTARAFFESKVAPSDPALRSAIDAALAG